MPSAQPALLASLLLRFCWVVGTPARPADPTHTLPSHGLAMALDLSTPLICMVDSSPFLKTLIKCLPGRHSCPDDTALYYDPLYVSSFPFYHFARSKGALRSLESSCLKFTFCLLLLKDEDIIWSYRNTYRCKHTFPILA